MSILDSVNQSIAALDLDDKDSGAVALARLYASQIDAKPDRSDTLGPKLVDVLDRLFMTPKARASAMKGTPHVVQTENPLDELRKRRSARTDRAPSVDTASS